MTRTVHRCEPGAVDLGYGLVRWPGLSLLLAAAVAALHFASRFPADLREEMRRVGMPARVQAKFVGRGQVSSEDFRDLTPEQKEVFKKCLDYRPANSPDVVSIILGLLAAALGLYSAIAFPVGLYLLRRSKS